MNHSLPARRGLTIAALVVRYQQAIVILAGVALSVAAALALIRFGPVLAAAVVALALAPVVVPALLQRPILSASGLVLVLSSFPIGRLSIGPLPIYLMDIAIAVTLVGLVLQRYPEIDRVGKAILVYLFLWVPTLLSQMARLGVVVESVYGLMRHGLPIATFFIGWALYRQLRSTLFRTCVYVGVSITCVLAVMQFLPATHGIMRDIHFAVIPATAPSLYRVYPERGSAFFLAPTGLSGFLALVLPFIAIDLLRPKRLQHPLSRAVVALTVLGLIGTVSRQWVPAAIVGFWAFSRLQPRSRGPLIRASGVLALLTVGVLALGVVDAGYVGVRFGRLLNPTQDQNLTGRWQSQAKFVRYAGDNPEILVVGNGFATQDIAARGLVSEQEAGEIRSGVTENSWLNEFYNHGLAAGLIYIGVIVAVVRRGWRAARRLGDPDAHLAGLVAIVLVGIVLHFTDRFMSETEYTRAWFWLVIGWLAKEAAIVEGDAGPAPADGPMGGVRTAPGRLSGGGGWTR